MTPDVLQSDIELATRLRDEQRPSDEIIRALVHRGVDPVKAAQLLDDLLNGRSVAARSTLGSELGLRRRSRAMSTATGGETRVPSRSPAGKHRRQPRARPAPEKQEGSKHFQRIFLTLAALAVVAVGLALFLRAKSDKTAGEEPNPMAVAPKANAASPEAPTKVAAVAQRTLASPLVLELRPDGLRLGDNVLPRDSFLPAVYKLLGAASRTNHVTRTGAVIYAYDQLGLLIYSQPGGGTNSIVLDCDATGGVNGTTSPFAGLLKLENRVIGPDLEAQQLTAITELGLKHPGGSETVWNGRYHGVDLVFAYLKTPQRPSLIELDVK